MNRSIALILVLLLITILSGCRTALVGDHFEFWRKSAGVYSIDDVLANRERGNISRIALYWVPLNSLNMRKDESSVWEVAAEKPIPFAGFQFQVFTVPSGFRLVRDERRLPIAGYYYLEVYGSPRWSILLGDIPSCEDVLDWKQEILKQQR